MQEEKKIGLDFSFGEDTDTETALVFETENTHSIENKSINNAQTANKLKMEFEIPDVPAKNTVEHKVLGSKPEGKLQVGRSRVSTSKDSFGFRDELAGLDYSIDPTAEPDSKIRMLDATVVNVTGKTASDESYEAQSTVFKFAVEDDEAELLKVTEVASEPYVPQKNEVKEPVSEPAETTEKKTYDIPDPFAHKNALIDIDGERLPSQSNVPVGDETGKGKKKKSEFNTLSERDGFKDKFLDAIMAHRIRLIAALILSSLILIVENLKFFDISIPSRLGFEGDGVVMAVIDLVFIVCMLALALPECVKAFKWIAFGRVVPELFIPIGAFVALVYYAVIFIHVPIDYPLFGLAFSLIATSSIIASLIKKKVDFANFKNISTASEKYIVDRKMTRSLPDENMATDGAVEGYKSKTARIFRAIFITDFFKRSGKCSENSAHIVVLIAANLAIALVSGTVAFFVLDGLYSAVKTFTTVFMVGMPVFSILSHKTSFKRAVKCAQKEKSTFIGESAVLDYAGVDVLTFNDTEIFTNEDVSLQRIMLYGRNDNLEKAMYQMSSVFASVGGPLAGIFADSIEYAPTPAKNVRIDENGIVADVHGNQVRAGNLEYMLKCGISIPEDTSKDNAALMSTKVMYAAENGEIYAKFYIRYTLSEEFTMIMPSLIDDGIIPLVYTKDPNIDVQLMRALTAGADTIRVCKKLAMFDPNDKVHERVSAGLVTTGDKLNVINMLSLAKRYAGFHSVMTVVEMLAMVVGAGLAILLAFARNMMSEIPSACLSVWQIAWCIAFAVMSKRAIKSNVDYTKRD